MRDQDNISNYPTEEARTQWHPGAAGREKLCALLLRRAISIVSLIIRHSPPKTAPTIDDLDTKTVRETLPRLSEGTILNMGLCY